MVGSRLLVRAQGQLEDGAFGHFASHGHQPAEFRPESHLAAIPPASKRFVHRPLFGRDSETNFQHRDDLAFQAGLRGEKTNTILLGLLVS